MNIATTSRLRCLGLMLCIALITASTTSQGQTHNTTLTPVANTRGVFDTLGLVVNIDGNLSGKEILLQGVCDGNTQTVSIQNTLLLPLTITGLSISGKDAEHFTLLNSTLTLPTILQSGEQVELDLKFNCGEDAGLYEADLNITLLDFLEIEVFAIRAEQLPQSSVERNESDVYVSMSPNPTQGIARIETSNTTSSRIQILNMLGQIVAEHEGVSFTWDSRGTGNPVSAGAYIVRVSGVRLDGQPFTDTRQIIVE